MSLLQRQPVIVVFEASRAIAEAALRTGASDGMAVLQSTLIQCLSTALPVVLVAGAETAEQARRMMALRDIVVAPCAGGHTSTAPDVGVSVAMGVAARPHARGWIVLPGTMGRIQPSTLHAVARALLEHPVSHATFRARAGYPAGFGAEMFSELTALRAAFELRRLWQRYPSHAVEADDPGVMLGGELDEPLDGLVQAGPSTGTRVPVVDDDGEAPRP